MNEPLFEQRGGRFIPSVHTRGPWDPESQHGGAPAALLSRAIEQVEPGADMVLARITYDFLGPVPLAPLTATAEIVRAGRRYQLVEAQLETQAGPVARARAVRLRRGDVVLPVVALAPDGVSLPGPETARHTPFEADTGDEGFGRTGMEIRWVQGSYAEPGPAQAWFRFARPLVDDEHPSPIQRAAAAADFGNGISRVLAFADHLFVNTDLTMHLHREPTGEWVLLNSVTVAEPAGVGMARSGLYDNIGPIGLAVQTLYLEKR